MTCNLKESNIMFIYNSKVNSKEFHFRLPVGMIKDLIDLSQKKGNEKFSNNLPIKTMKIILALFKGRKEYTEEFVFKLPLRIIRKLIVSYWENIKECDEESVYFHQSGGYSLWACIHGNLALNTLKGELNRNCLNGQKIINEEFNRNFKKDYEDMKKFQKKEEKVEKHIEKVLTKIKI